MTVTKKTRKTPTKFVTFITAIEEYKLNIGEVLSLLKCGHLTAFGKFDNDYTITTQREECYDYDITAETWRGDYGWEFDEKNVEIINGEHHQKIFKIRFERKHLIAVINQHYDPNKLKTRSYNWEVIALQVAAYLHSQPVSEVKSDWFKQIENTIPMFKSGPYPKYETYDSHLGIVYNVLKNNKVDWNQYVRG